MVNADDLAYALNYFGLFFINDLTDIAFSKFKKKMKRSFLFDKECVSDEILAHLKGYLWCVGKIKSFPLKFYVYYYTELKKKDRTFNNIVYRVKQSCKQADIKESDVYLNKAEASSLVGFDYFNHIQKCYINTKNDPYYNSKTKQRDEDYERKEWLYEKLKEK